MEQAHGSQVLASSLGLPIPVFSHLLVPSENGANEKKCSPEFEKVYFIYVCIYRSHPTQSYYNIIDYIPCAVHYIPVTYLFYNWCAIYKNIKSLCSTPETNIIL